jgi:hypothetical protein
MQSTTTRAHSVPLHSQAETSRRLQTIPSTSTAPRATPVVALSHALVSTHVRHATDWSVEHVQTSRNQRSSAERSCCRARPRTVAPIAPKLARAPESAMLTARELTQATKPCNSSLQTAVISGGSTRGAHTVERSLCCPSARASPPGARVDCPWIAAMAASSFPATLKGGTSSCGSTLPVSRNVHPCGKDELGEREGRGAGAAGVQACCSFTRHHYPSLVTRPRRLVLPHTVSSLSILRDEGDSGDSQQGIKTMPLSTSMTLMAVLTTHPSEESARLVHGERHDVAGAPPRGPRTALSRERKFPEK